VKRIETDLPGVVVIEPRVFGDSRGFFFEALHVARYRDAGILFDDAAVKGPVQLNHSRSVMRTLRGLHYQEPHAQGKLVWVVAGSIFDVAVDIRRGSPTFGCWTGIELNAENRRQIWIPAGFAHGFCVLSENADCLYACSDYYAPECEYAISWADGDIGIRWPIMDPILSERDARAPKLRDALRLPSYAG
jgi:dTDP-4-dehydrorhamnose 3,5-epimerase